jgi:hypothetical protein
MKIKIKTSTSFFFIVAMTASGLTYANADDTKWIAQCLLDNAKGASTEVVQKYCECMNDKMDENETLSITQWEKSHPKEEKECDAVAGWK